MKLDTWGLAADLRAAGLTVIETPGWKGRSHGDLPGNPAVVWHHDASLVGDSPGALEWMISNYPTASAQIWINRYGVVYLVGVGVAWHAGKVLPGQEQFDNFHSIGIETDHTTDEDWPSALLRSLRLATFVILRKGGRPLDAFSFHRLICSPVGRKSDPAGLSLTTERAQVAALHFVVVGNRADDPTPEPKDYLDMATEADLKNLIQANATPFRAVRHNDGRVWVISPRGDMAHVTPEQYDVLLAAKLIQPSPTEAMNDRSIDVLAGVLAQLGDGVIEGR